MDAASASVAVIAGTIAGAPNTCARINHYR